MFGSGSAAQWVDRICAATRAENQPAGRRLVAVGELHVLRTRQTGGCEQWATDTWDAVAAALRGRPRAGVELCRVCPVLRRDLPQVGALLVAGDISYSTFQTIVYRTGLITDPQIMATVDAALAARARRCASMTHGRLGALADTVVARLDGDAVRRRRESLADRELSIFDNGDGLAEVFGKLISTDAHAVDPRLNALADTVCEHDPRTRKQRRADAMGALAAGAQRLTCRCARPDCPAATTAVPAPVVIHLIAEQASLHGTGTTPAAMLGAEDLIPAELLAELTPPLDAPPEPRYTPSRALAAFVRCRDLTCGSPAATNPPRIANSTTPPPTATAAPPTRRR